MAEILTFCDISEGLVLLMIAHYVNTHGAFSKIMFFVFVLHI